MLEKILEEIRLDRANINTLPGGDADKIIRMCYKRVERIICKHMGDDWISVEEQLPPIGERLLAKIKHHKWISDYDTAYVPEEDKIMYSEYMEICEITGGADGIWQYVNLDDGLCEAYINPGENLAYRIDEVIAWRPMPEEG